VAGGRENARENEMTIRKIHHVAYRCVDAQQTIEWYGKYLGMHFILAIAEDNVPSTGEPDPYMHVFLDAGGGNILAFFELPTRPPMDRDRNTPAWTQHIAFEVGSLDELLTVKRHLQADGFEVVGITDHTLFKSIYFFDPSGHRLELAFNTATPAMMDRLDAVKWEMIDECRTRKAPKHAAWMHDGSHAS